MATIATPSHPESATNKPATKRSKTVVVLDMKRSPVEPKLAEWA
jgi:hypothetical protein